MNTQNRTIKISIMFIFSAVLVFHFLILSGVIPYENTWGGRLKSHQEMIQFETISIAVNLFFMFLVAVKAKWLKINFPARLLTVLFWGMSLIFAVNTLGNLVAINSLEKYIATPITLILSILTAILAREKASA
ncbi:hypothetical protein [Runella salmonicolor]|uniref:Uncharacterized protein n=1 Tax=Runella salmonicolor TaxID=2950278 RepID=A0ABT1FKK0_9BACT|nr:hypothetical protein [Runella salmonicolor]MCP1382284.1 hypothetical protein [Runella salmonicolor]